MVVVSCVVSESVPDESPRNVGIPAGESIARPFRKITIGLQRASHWPRRRAKHRGRKKRKERHGGQTRYTRRRRHRHRRAPSGGRKSGTRLAWRVPLGHARHQGRDARRAGRRTGPRLHAARLFRPWRIGRRLRRRHDLEMAQAKHRGVRALHDRPADPGRVLDGRLDRVADDTGAEQGLAGRQDRRAGAAGAGAGLHA